MPATLDVVPSLHSILRKEGAPMAPRKTSLTLAASGGMLLPPKPPAVAPCDGRAIRCPVTGLECVRGCESPATCQIKPEIDTALNAARAASHAIGAAIAAFERCESGIKPSNECMGDERRTAYAEELLKGELRSSLMTCRADIVALVRHYERRAAADRLGPPVEPKPWRTPGS